MPPQAEHADDNRLYYEGEKDPITFLPVSPLAEQSYGNPIFKEKEADHGGAFAESNNVVDSHKQIQNPPAPVLGGQVNQPHLPPQNQPAVGGPVQLEPIKVAPCVTDLGNQQHLQENIDRGILQFPKKAKQTMGVDANPFPDLSVGVNVADLGSLNKDKNRSYSKRKLTANDLRWVIKEAKTRKDQARSDPPRGRTHEGHDPKQQKTGPSQSAMKFGYEG
ncbi:hypothetical protein SLEP1_g18777 [Rubroshorea leprosula]|uniref:Uncharacterized protein n=1 Tax=Rubroshorea leprosula TaxID=152421 RepID=A0AAV5J4N2_9ROSI|nr:hypothetical protein SLEP1_g18777 [Rubroshorea leprosula]